MLFFFNATATTETYTLSLHDALPISFIVGHVVAWVYMWTHDGLSYSRMFTASLLALPVVVALVMILMAGSIFVRSEEHTSELQSRLHLVCRLLLEKKK